MRNPKDMTVDERYSILINAFCIYIMLIQNCSVEEACRTMADACELVQKKV